MNRRAQQPIPQPESHHEEPRADRSPREGRGAGDGPSSGRALVVRVYWMFLGFIPIVASIASIAESEGGPAADLAYWASVASIVLARLYDVTRLDGRTAEGEPATLADWRRFSGIVFVAAGVLWLAVRTIPGRS